MKKTPSAGLRPLTREDAAFLCSIFKGNDEYYQIFFDSEENVSQWEQRVARFLSQSGIHHFIIEAQEAPVGWFSFINTGPAERELGIFVIKQEHLRRGYGTQILRQFIETCKTEHVRRISLNVTQSNARAIRFYQKFGFEIIAEEIIPECNDAVDLAQYQMKLELS